MQIEVGYQNNKQETQIIAIAAINNADCEEALIAQTIEQLQIQARHRLAKYISQAKSPNSTLSNKLTMFINIIK